MRVLIGVGMLACLFAACSGGDHGSPSSGAGFGSGDASGDAPGGANEGGRGASNTPPNGAGSGAEEPEADPNAEHETPASGGAGGASSLDEHAAIGGEIGNEEPHAEDGFAGGPSTSEGGHAAHGGATASAGTGGAPSAGQSSVGGRPSSAGAGGTPSASAGARGIGFPVGDALEGELIELDYGCRSCHGADFGGAGMYPNLTSDPENGIGAWSDAQIARAIRNGQNEVGESLCALMPRYPFTDQKVAHLIAYLRSFPPSSKNIGQVCPGHGR